MLKKTSLKIFEIDSTIKQLDFKKSKIINKLKDISEKKTYIFKLIFIFFILARYTE